MHSQSVDSPTTCDSGNKAIAPDPVDLFLCPRVGSEKKGQGMPHIDALGAKLYFEETGRGYPII
jgi:hypothetical protein